MPEEVKVTLGTLCDGEMEGDFQDSMQQVVTALKEGEKGTVNIGITFQRMQGTTTIIAAGYTISHKLPVTKKASICTITADYHLVTEAPVQKPENVVLFSKEEKA